MEDKMFDEGTKHRSLSLQEREVEGEAKVELHLHLDCSLSYNVVKKIDPSISEEQYRHEFVAPPKCEDLMDFLKRASKGFTLMQTKEALQWVVEDLFEQLKNDNVIYAEIRFAPFLHLEKGLTPYEVVQATEAATAAAVKRTGVEARLILCTLRHYTEEQSMATVKLVEQFAGTYVAGFDIAGDEAGCPVTNHLSAFKYAQEKKLHITAHAGEAAGPQSVWETLEHFKPTRIGHGARSIEDAKLVAHLRDKKIHLEICPSCNVQTSMYDTYKDHPVDTLKKKGVPLNINTDCRTIVDVNLNTEYKRLQENFGWTKKDFYECNVDAVRAAFIPDELKTKLLAQLAAGYQ
jgi:adenosine deaminase